MGRISNKKRKNVNKSDRSTTLPEKAVLGSIALLLTFIVFTIFTGFTALFKVGSGSMPTASNPKSGEAVNILLIGMDIGDPDQVDNQAVKRTDTILVVNYNPNTKNLQLVSVPRDTLIKTNNGNAKINAAYALGGYSKIKGEVENLLNININYIVKIDYNAFVQVVDAIGGVNMEIERNMIYDDEGQNLHINFKAGETVKLNGQKAQEFFRWRKNNDGSGFANGDLDRIQNQQKFISKVVDKLKSPMTIFRLPKILNAISDNVETNMPSTKIIKYGFKCLSASKDGLGLKTAAGTPKMINGQSYLIFDKDSNKELISSLSSSAKPSNNTSKVDKSKVRIKVLNGTKVNGLAGNVKSIIENLGYTNVDTGNAEVTEKTTVLTNNKDLLQAIKNDMSIKKSADKDDRDEYKQYDAIIIIGKDYKKFGE